ncbi:MAG: hypothetical protein V3V92_03165 [Candidatus Hydrothermarchaeales archaeon]
MKEKKMKKKSVDTTEESTGTPEGGVVPPVKEYSGSPFWPGEVLSEGGVMLLTIAMLFFFGAILPAPLGEEANPMKTLHPIYPEWYLLSVFGFVRLWVWDLGPIPAKLIGLIAPLGIGVLILLLPFFDKWDKGSGEGQLKHILRRKWGAIIGIGILAIIVFMSAMAVMLEKGIVSVG